MLTIEEFKVELFQKLLEARKAEHDRLFVIPKEKFSKDIPDIRVFMDSEMQRLVTVYPYQFSYVMCESDADKLAFLDIIPDIKDESGVITQTYYLYDCDSHKVVSFINIVKPV